MQFQKHNKIITVFTFVLIWMKIFKKLVNIISKSLYVFKKKTWPSILFFGNFKVMTKYQNSL